jgi:hypothetical protein
MSEQKTFIHFPTTSLCPLCKTNVDEECCLIPIDGTTNGYTSEAQAMHVNCIIQLNKFRYNKEVGVLYRNLQER